MAAPVRVLQVISGLGMGGAETWLMELLRLWTKDGSAEVDFLLTGGKPDIFDAEAAALGAGLHYLPYGRSNLARFIPAYRRLLRHGRYDVIHDHADYAGGWRFLLGLGVLPPMVVSHVHNPWLHITANYAVTPLRRVSAAGGQKLVDLLATRIVGTSASILRQYGFDPGRRQKPRVEVIHCGIDVSLFNRSRDPDRTSVLQEFQWPDDSKIVLFAGRLDRALQLGHPQNHKNSWFALQIVRAALEREPRIRLLMAGAGEEPRAALTRHVAEWGLQDRLKVIGIRRDVPRLMRAADLLLFPSRQEGLGMVAVEAQAAGLPVLASTAVPREAVVVPELVTFLPLTEPPEAWASTLLNIAAQSRAPAEKWRPAFDRSDFAIANSAHKLLRLYRGE